MRSYLICLVLVCIIVLGSFTISFASSSPTPVHDPVWDQNFIYYWVNAAGQGDLTTGTFLNAFSRMTQSIMVIGHNAYTANSNLSQIYTKVYDILDTIVNHASIVSSNFTLVRIALDGISGYLNNIMSYTASTRDNTLAIADRLMYNNLSAAEYLDSINNHFVAANNQIRTLHSDNLNSNRYYELYYQDKYKITYH